MRPEKALVPALAVALAVASGAASAQQMGPEALGFKKHFTVEITNPSALSLENHAIIIDVAAIRAEVAPDFNTYMYMFFDVSRGEYGHVVSQADDLDKDRYHDEIVLVRTLPAKSTTRLACYYAPGQSFQVMPPQKAFARGPWEQGKAEAGWESNLAAFDFIDGRIGFFGKLKAGLVLKDLPAALAGTSEWGRSVLDPGDSAGLGGLSLYDGTTRVPLFGTSAPRAKLTVISPGPVRGLIKAEFPAVKTARGEVALTVYFSAFGDNAYSRQDVVISSKTASPVLLGPGLQKLPGETWGLDKAKGTYSSWGRGPGKAGEIGLAAIFAPGDLAGLDEASTDRTVRLNARPDRRLTYWVAGAWQRGLSAPESAGAKGWAGRVDDLASRLLVPVKVEFKAR